MHDPASSHEPPAIGTPAPQPVAAGPVAILPGQPMRATWARVGLLGIGVAALIAAAILVFGSTFRPNGTLAAGSGDDTESATQLHWGGGPGHVGGPGGHIALGGITITSISGSSISLQTDDGWTRTITVDDETEYARAGDEITLGDLAVGDTIGFRQTREDDGTWTIDAIVVLLPRVGGEVTAIDGTTITVERRDGSTATINVSGDTTIRVNGDDAALADVEVGMFVMAEGEQAGDDAIDAERLFAGDLRELRDLRGPDGPRGGPWFQVGPFGDAGEPDATPEAEGTGTAS